MIDFDKQGHVLVITINRPEAKNAVNGDVAQGIEGALDYLEDDDDLWIGILTGAGDVFSAGADLKAINSGEGASLMTERGGFAGLVIRERTKPLIAAVDGAALAGGCEICLACDLVVASSAARFGVPEVKRSLVAGAGAMWRLARVLPQNVAMEMALTGDPISAERAHELGMVNVLCEPGQAVTAAHELAERINACAPVAVRETRRLIHELRNADDAEGTAASNGGMATAMSSQDFNEGLMAFIEKRDPQWTGR
jgi:enoyl-CoA hydratase